MIRSLRQLAQEGNQAAFVALLVRRDPWAKQLALGVLREPHQISLPLLDAIATLQDAEFAAPLAEAYPKLDGYSQSRALLALLALGDSRALEQALQYPIQWSPQSREIRPYFHILQTLITTSRSSTVRKACLRLLAEPGASEGPFLSPETVALLVDLMGDADAIVRTVAKEYLLTRGLPTPLSAELADRIAAECLRDFDRSPDQERAQALQVLSRVWHSLGERHRQDAVEKSLKALWSVSPELQRAAVYALSWSSDPAVWNELLLLLYTSSDAKTSLLSAIANYDRLHGYTPQTALIPLLDDSNPYRWYAAAGQFHTEAAQRLIRRALEGDNEEDTIHALRLLLQRYGDTDVQHLAVRRARGLLSAGTEETRTLADAILLRYDPEYAYQRVSAALLDPSPSVRRSVLDRATALLRHPEAVALLMPIFERWDFDLQRIALISLSQIPGAQATDAIRRLTSHPEPGVRIFANQILLGRKG
jgi:HEAT repeat protein